MTGKLGKRSLVFVDEKCEKYLLKTGDIVLRELAQLLGKAVHETMIALKPFLRSYLIRVRTQGEPVAYFFSAIFSDK